MRKPLEFVKHPVSFLDAKNMGGYRAVCTHVVDGDTFDFLVDLGLHQYAYITVRLEGVDTAEIYGKDASPEGMEAKEFVEGEILGAPCILFTGKDVTSFGRFVATVYYDNKQSEDWSTWHNLAAILASKGYAQ